MATTVRILSSLPRFSGHSLTKTQTASYARFREPWWGAEVKPGSKPKVPALNPLDRALINVIDKLSKTFQHKCDTTQPILPPSPYLGNNPVKTFLNIMGPETSGKNYHFRFTSWKDLLTTTEAKLTGLEIPPEARKTILICVNRYRNELPLNLVPLTGYKDAGDLAADAKLEMKRQAILQQQAAAQRSAQQYRNQILQERDRLPESIKKLIKEERRQKPTSASPTTDAATTTRANKTDSQKRPAEERRK
eukprot:TRINITY_DN829_c0_g1::TRINITY_DN829_c0_g1_i1::g.25422::m.25422 TRINITY_DN829_c0_g1::TRINITY_DN829_c0_g1_i1::g.25422  ORF type:complete len:261 (-),score=7.77,IGR/PF09597.5/5.1e-06 TRINITY_DN829_c0_g1_i1:16-762(-)